MNEKPTMTPREWQERTGIEVLDADGWRGADARSFDDEISEDEFRYRASHSVIRTTRAVWSDSPAEALEAALMGSDEDDDGDTDA